MKILSGVLAVSALVVFLLSFAPRTGDGNVGFVAADSRPIINGQEFAEGRALFRNKGCVTCHKHDDVDGPSGEVSIGQDLSHYKPAPEFVRNWLRDPAAIRPKTPMSDLHLSESEISALITFLSGRPESICPTTQPPTKPFVPPAPYSPESPVDDHFWFGSNELWTLLRDDGEWDALPKSEKGYGQKVVWWREGYDWQNEPLPELVVTGRRLDGAAAPLTAYPATNGYHPDYGSFMLVGVEIPTAGCWELSGQYGDHRLSFIVSVTS